MKKHFFSVFLVAFFSISAGAIVIVPPAIYFVTLSVATFIANSIIGLLALVAVSGLAGKKFFGKKLSELFSYFFAWLKKAAIALFSMILPVFLVKPIELFSVLLGAFLAFAVCFVVFFASNYSTYRVSVKKEKTSMFFSGALFSLFIFGLFCFSAFASIETQLVQTKGFGDFYSQAEPLPGLEIPSADAFPAGAQSPQAKESAQETTKPLAGTFIGPKLWFYPLTSKECTVVLGSQSFSFTPSESCYFTENNATVRIFCPVFISLDNITQRGPIDLAATGSCMAQDRITVFDYGFEVDAN